MVHWNRNLSWRLAFTVFIFFSVISISSSAVHDGTTSHDKDVRPLVIIHGLFEHSSSLSSLKRMITKVFPGITIYIPDLFPGYFSVWTPLWKQVESFNEYLKPIFANTSKNGINLLCFSQGID